jgi:hypothetical protein
MRSALRARAVPCARFFRDVVPRAMESSTSTTRLEQISHGVQLQLDAEIADGLRQFDERAANVVVANRGLPVRQPASSVTDGAVTRSRAQVHHIGLRMAPRQ